MKACFLYTYVHTYVHTHTHAHVHVRVHTHIQTYIYIAKTKEDHHMSGFQKHEVSKLPENYELTINTFRNLVHTF